MHHPFPTGDDEMMLPIVDDSQAMCRFRILPIGKLIITLITGYGDGIPRPVCGNTQEYFRQGVNTCKHTALLLKRKC
jgi:hypothetical protein